MIGILASAVVVLSGLYFVVLAIASFLAPGRVERFLSAFAGSAGAHYSELLIRLVVGGSFLLASPDMLFAPVFRLFGWVLVITTVVLFAVPWRWHHRFAQQTVPYAVRHLRLFGVASFVLGGFILTSVICGAA
jgi:uncharacterized protein YjeT (DUF2065 family)